MEQSKERDIIFAFLREHPAMVLGTLGRENMPQLSAVYVYIDDDAHFYFVTRNTTRKSRNIAKNEHIALYAYEESTMECVEVSGRARQVNNQEIAMSKLGPIQTLSSKANSVCWMPPVGQVDGYTYWVHEIIPERMVYYNYGACEGMEPKPIIYESVEEFQF